MLVLPFKRKPGRPSKAQLQLQRQQQQASAAALAAAAAAEAAAAPPAPPAPPVAATLASSRPQRRASATVKQEAAAAAAVVPPAVAVAVSDAPEVTRQAPRGRGRPKKVVVASTQRHSPRVARTSSVCSSSNGKSDAMDL
eukprot:11080-Heterococcus_DN1.PRE.1